MEASERVLFYCRKTALTIITFDLLISERVPLRKAVVLVHYLVGYVNE